MIAQNYWIILLAFWIGLLYLLLIRSLDIYEKEPILKLALVTILGGVIAIGATLFLYQFEEVNENFIDAIFKIGITEEISKLIALFMVYRLIKKELNEIVDGIVYISAISLGFSIIENIMYATHSYDPISNLYSRSIFATLGHISFSGYMGIAFYIHKKVKQNYLGLLFALILSSLAHGLYDGVIFTGLIGSIYMITFIGLVVLQVWFFRLAMSFSQFRWELANVKVLKTDKLLDFYCSGCGKDIAANELIYEDIKGGYCSTCELMIFDYKNFVKLLRYFRPLLMAENFLWNTRLRMAKYLKLDSDSFIHYELKTHTISANHDRLDIWLKKVNESDKNKVLAIPIVGFILRNIGIKYLV